MQSRRQSVIVNGSRLHFFGSILEGISSNIVDGTLCVMDIHARESRWRINQIVQHLV